MATLERWNIKSEKMETQADSKVSIVGTESAGADK